MTNLNNQEIDFLNSIFDLAREGKVIAIESLLNQGIPVDLTNAKGDTLLILATYHEHEPLVDLLIKRGAQLNALNDRGQTALVCAVFRNNAALTRKLLEAGADIELGHQSPAEVAHFFDLPEMTELIRQKDQQAS